MRNAGIDGRLAEDIGAFYADPLGYVLYAFEWGRGELAPWPEGPDRWQRELLQALGEALGARVLTAQEALRVAVKSGHGTGKSTLIVWVILWAMSTRPHLAGVVTANTATQLETKTWRELSVWHKRALNGHWFEWTATRFYQRQHPETWAVTAIPWNEKRPEAFAGLHAEHVLVIFDEASAIPDVIWEVSEGATTTPGALWMVCGNPTRNTGRFRECWGKFRHRWERREVDSRTARMANQVQIRQWIEDYGEDSDFVRVRVTGQFPRAGSLQFIGNEVVNAAQARTVEADPMAPLVLGVDIARFGDDKTVLRWRRGRDARSLPALKFRGLDTMQVAARVAEAIEAHKPEAVFVDGGGVGGGVIDRLLQLRYRVIEVQAGADPRDAKKYRNKRAEMWGAMKDWLAAAAIDRDSELYDDLIGPEYGYDEQMRIQLERKRDMKRRGLASPDDGDALAMTFAQPVAPRDIRAQRQTRAVIDYPIFGG